MLKIVCFVTILFKFMSKEKPKNIGFDLDDVLLNFSDALREHMNRKYMKSVNRDDITTFFIEEAFGISPIDARETIDNFFFHQDHIDAFPVDGSKDVIDRLSKANKLRIITAKPDILEGITKEWIDKHFPHKFENIHFANWFSKDKIKRKKSEICIEYNIDIFIDDSPETARDVSSVGIPVLLFDTPWNREEKFSDNNVTRVYSWDQIEKEINNLI